MKNKISIAATDSTPALEFDMEKGSLSLTGKSIPQDPTLFYAPLIKQLDEYIANPAPQTTVTINLQYFNTPTAKYLQDIFQKLEALTANSKSVSVNWHYETGDTDMLQAGKDYQGIVNLSFSYKEIKES
ncbi:MAG: hypothetical protein POELPBGB_00979 [Bacteroidia bacterium]|nr:hypothetical protein [Bacteroidia bacterium]